MKRLRKCLLIAVFCLAAAMLVQPVKAQAKNPSKVVLKVGKTYKKYDVTGDKKKDRFKAMTSHLSLPPTRQLNDTISALHLQGFD